MKVLLFLKWKNIDIKSKEVCFKLEFFWIAYFKISKLTKLGFDIFEKIVLKISSRKNLRLSHNSVRRAINLWVMLIYFFGYKERLKAINHFF